MIAVYHRLILERAMDKKVSQRALKQIIAANLKQDAWYYQIIHPHFHFDNDAFETGNAFVASQRKTVIKALKNKDPFAAWKAFGRLSHAAQDFYAHSNYVALWLSGYGESDPSPEKIDPLDPALLASSELKSGHFYLPFELLYFIPAIRKQILPWLPRNSHAWMNIDEPSRSNFDYVMTAAIKCTLIEYELIAKSLDTSEMALFEDRSLEAQAAS
jgi:hypothetical protein